MNLLDSEKIVDEILSVDSAVRYVVIIDHYGNIVQKKVKENIENLTNEMEDLGHAVDLNIRKQMRAILDDSLGKTTFIYSIREKLHQLFFYSWYFIIYVIYERNLGRQTVLRISDSIESIIKNKINY